MLTVEPLAKRAIGIGGITAAPAVKPIMDIIYVRNEDGHIISVFTQYEWENFYSLHPASFRND